MLMSWDENIVVSLDILYIYLLTPRQDYFWDKHFYSSRGSGIKRVETGSIK